MQKVLEGIRILDLSRFFAGAFCSQLLVDFGAEVIKIETPVIGDPSRSAPPMTGNQSAMFYGFNRNKKSITLDLRKEAGKDIFKKLVSTSDVVLDLFRPGIMKKSGLDYEVLKEINPRLIYCSLNAYGSSGPLRYEAGHDINILSLAGVTGLTGNKGGKPSMSAVQIAGLAGGSLYASNAILLALLSREKTGQGQYCEVAMLDASISLINYALGEWTGSGNLPERGNALLTGAYAFYQIYECQDGEYISLGAIETKFWTEFCQKIEREDFIPLQWNIDMQDELIFNINEITKGKNREDWLKIFSDSNICLTPVLSIKDMTTHPHIIERDLLIKLENVNQSDKDLIMTATPIHLSETPREAVLEFPALGQHTEELLEELGVHKDDWVSLKNNGVI